MNKTIHFSLIVVLSLFIVSCASNYKPINPNILTYASKSTNRNNDILFEYKYDLLNKKYKRKESRHGLNIVAVKITNLSDKDLSFGKDLSLAYDNDTAINLLGTKEIYSEMRQVSLGYFLYLLLTPLQFTVTRTNRSGVRDSSTIPIGYFLGPGLAARNLITASSANRQFKAELKKFNLKDTLIKKGVTTYGLIGIRGRNYDALKIISL